MNKKTTKKLSKAQTEWDLSEERIKEVLWRRFCQAVSCEEADDANEAMQVVDHEFDIINELVGDNEVSFESFQEAFVKRYGPANTHTIVRMEIPLTPKDRGRIIGQVKGSCLSEEAKNAIIAGVLKTGG